MVVYTQLAGLLEGQPLVWPPLVGWEEVQLWYREERVVEEVEMGVKEVVGWYLVEQAQLGAWVEWGELALKVLVVAEELVELVDQELEPVGSAKVLVEAVLPDWLVERLPAILREWMLGVLQ